MPILVEAMEKNGHLQLTPEVRLGLLAMSAATIDRALHEVRAPGGGRKRRHAPPSAAIRRSVAVRTFDGWDNPAPGFVEADLVAHSGPTAKGSFVQTLTLTDIATGWTECAPLLVREQKLLTEALSEMRQRMPFPPLGFDTDNNSVFMNETVRTYCAEAELVFTRCRPYRKNDQAWVEQKNGAVVRHAVGYRRYEGLEAAAALARLYTALRLFVNFFQPSFKLATKTRDGAKVKETYLRPAIPCQRLLADTRASEEVRRQVRAIYATLDPVRLLQTIREIQGELVAIADRPVVGEAAAPSPSTLEQFLSGLRTAWQEGEVRPTSKPKPKARRGRRRPDPFVLVTVQMREWFEAEPWFGRAGRLRGDSHPTKRCPLVQIDLSVCAGVGLQPKFVRVKAETAGREGMIASPFLVRDQPTGSAGIMHQVAEPPSRFFGTSLVDHDRKFLLVWHELNSLAGDAASKSAA